MRDKQVFQPQNASKDSNERSLLKKILFQVYVVQMDVSKFQTPLKLESLSPSFVAYVAAKSWQFFKQRFHDETYRINVSLGSCCLLFLLVLLNAGSRQQVSKKEKV